MPLRRRASFLQSASILQYLAETLKKFDGKNAEEHARIREWMFWDFDRLAPGVYRSRAFALGIRKGEPAVVDSYKLEGEMGLKVLEEHLSKHDWLVGDRPTIADIDIYGVIFHASAGGFDLARFPKISEWKKRIESLPRLCHAGKAMSDGDKSGVNHGNRNFCAATKRPSSDS